MSASPRLLNRAQDGPHRRACRRAGRGSSLIELVVALGLSAIGMLALAATMAVTTKAARVQQHQARAVTLAQEMAERLRANPAAAAQGAYALEPPWADDLEAPPLPDCASEACTPAQRARLELADWAARIETTLPQGLGLVQVDTEALVASVHVAWVEAGDRPEDRAVATRHRCPAEAPVPPAARCVGLRVSW